MADKKISQLTAATTPLAGTEVLPIVQSGSTVKVSVDNLTAGKSVSATTFTSTVGTGTAPFTVASTTVVANLNASSLNGATFASPGAIGSTTASTGKFTTVQATDATAFKTNSTSGQYLHFDASSGNNFIGLESANNLGLYIGGYKALGATTSGTLNNVSVSTGNLVISTAAKGIDFSANTHAAGMTSELLNWYEEGTWTGTIKGTTTDPTTPVTATGTYTRIGRQVTVGIAFNDFISTGISGNLKIAGLPFTADANQRFYLGSGDNANITATPDARPMVESSTTNIQFVNSASFVAAVATTGCYLWVTVTYFV